MGLRCPVCPWAQVLPWHQTQTKPFSEIQSSTHAEARGRAFRKPSGTRTSVCIKSKSVLQRQSTHRPWLSNCTWYWINLNTESEIPAFDGYMLLICNKCQGNSAADILALPCISLLLRTIHFKRLGKKAGLSGIRTAESLPSYVSNEVRGFPSYWTIPYHAPGVDLSKVGIQMLLYSWTRYIPNGRL